VADPRHEKLAAVLVEYSARVTAGDLVLIEAPVAAEPLVRELYRAVVRARAHPLTRIEFGEIEETLMLEASEDQLDWVNPVRYEDIERADVRLVVEASLNTRALTSVDPEREARRSRARDRLRNRYLERAAAGELRWTLTGFPTEATAQDARMSLGEYENFVYGAGFLDDPDPPARWREFGERIEQIASFLGEKDELRVIAEGTDLVLGVGGRTWIAAKGHENFPDGEVFTAPHETRVDGEIRFTYPTIFQGREVTDVRLRFEAGEVVGASAGRGAQFLEEMIAMDEGARRVGEFAFGLNEAVTMFTRDIGLDEKIGGTVHLALGTAYPETGGLNRSGLHWDMICDLRSESEVYADGELVYRNGRFIDVP
jgi:aminopeptidase